MYAENRKAFTKASTHPNSVPVTINGLMKKYNCRTAEQLQRRLQIEMMSFIGMHLLPATAMPHLAELVNSFDKTLGTLE